MTDQTQGRGCARCGRQLPSHHDATIIEVCTSCRGTIGDQLGLTLMPARDKGAFGCNVCHACRDVLDPASIGMVSITPGGVWWVCPHLPERRHRQSVADMQ
jgi:hypothetical protein